MAFPIYSWQLASSAPPWVSVSLSVELERVLRQGEAKQTCPRFTQPERGGIGIWIQLCVTLESGFWNVSCIVLNITEWHLEARWRRWGPLGKNWKEDGGKNKGRITCIKKNPDLNAWWIPTTFICNSLCQLGRNAVLMLSLHQIFCRFLKGKNSLLSLWICFILGHSCLPGFPLPLSWMPRHLVWVYLRFWWIVFTSFSTSLSKDVGSLEFTFLQHFEGSLSRSLDCCSRLKPFWFHILCVWLVWFYISLGFPIRSLLVSDALKFGADVSWFGFCLYLCAGIFQFGNFWLQFWDFLNITISLTISLSFLLLSIWNS